MAQSVGTALRKTAVDRLTNRHPGYAISQCIRKRIEEILRSGKINGGLDQLKVRGIEKAKTTFVLGLEDRYPLFGIML
jgi:hypothetical protein